MAKSNKAERHADVLLASVATPLMLALDELPLGLATFDTDGKIDFRNGRLAEICGLPAEDVCSCIGLADLLGLLDPAFAAGCVFDAAAPARCRYRSSDGRAIAVTVSATSDGGGMVVCQDVTDQEDLSARLALQQQLTSEQEDRFRTRNMQFDTAINNMSVGLCFFDGAQRLIVCNERYIDMYDLPRDRVAPGISLGEIVDMRFAAGSVPEMSREDYMVWRSDVAISALATDSAIELRNGRTFLIRHRPMADSGWVATHEDITERRQFESRIARMARHDALTDLANRLLLGERLEQAVTQIAQDSTIAVHHIDLDQFKFVNDTLGHPIGDKLLQMVADRLRALIGPDDTIARTGGDEFVLVQIAVADTAQAADLARCIIASLSEPYGIDGHQAVIGVSIGIAVGPGDGLDPNELLRSADLALYRAKSEGRGTFRFFEPAMNLRMQARRLMEQDLRKALPAGEFELHYQPVVNLSSNTISGFEALIRWNHPDKGMISPNAFIPMAEEIGLIAPIGAWVIQEACTTAAQWPDDLHVAVNVSAVQFRTPGLLQTITRALAESGLHPTRLEIEITETALLQDKDAILAVLHQLRALGVRIAMDDFGIGYSSLTYLQSFPFDKIKIDRSFVSGVTDNASSLSIVRAIAALAHGMGMVATAEGVETTEQRDRITSEGCTEMQGFLFSKPLPADDVARLLQPHSDGTVAA